MTFIFILIFAVGVTFFLFMKQPIFGAEAKGNRLERIKKSPNFKNERFQNLEVTPNFGEGYNMPKVIWDFFMVKTPNKVPTKPVNTKKTDLKIQDSKDDFLVWMGHSSYYFQLEGQKFLVDPVFSGNASPIFGTTRAFVGADIYDTNDFPELDYLVITHDHYDHLDYKTVKSLKSKIKKIICPLGVGAHLEHWGFSENQLIELDWYENATLDNGLSIISTPARHFSGRGFKRNITLWSSYVLKSEHQSIFVGGDSGYGQHFKTIGDKYGPFNWAILENGQYNERWHYIHTLPEETVKVIEDLGAKNILPVHSSKFSLAMHPWTEPLDKIVENSHGKDFKIYTPMIGEKLLLNDTPQTFQTWWKA